MSELTTQKPLVPEVAERAPRGPVLRSQLTPQADEPHDGVPLREYLDAIRRHWWLVATAAVISVAFAGWRMTRELPIYRASTSVRLRDPSTRISGELGSGTGPATEQLTGYYSDPVLSQIQVLRSRAVAGMVVDSLGMRLQPQKPDFPYASVGRVAVNSNAREGDTLAVSFAANGVTGTMRGQRRQALYGQSLELPGVSITFVSRPRLRGTSQARFVVTSYDAAVSILQGRIEARPRELTNFIDIGYTAFDPNQAQRVADATASAFQELNATSAQQASRRRALFVAEQLRSTDSLLLTAQMQLSGFRKSVNAFSPQEKFRTTQEGLSDLRLRREELDQEKRIYDQMYQALSTGGEGGNDQIAAMAASPQVSNNGGLLALYQQMLRYQTVRDSMTTGRFSSSVNNPDIQRLDSLVLTARSRLTRAAAARSTALAAQIQVMDGLMASDAASVSQLPDAEAEEQRLRRQVETLQKLADDLLREQQKARIDQAVETGQVEVVDHALVPGGPMGRNGKKRMFFALLVGLLIGGGGALVLDRLNTALYGREEIESLLHLPVLAIVPRVSLDGPKRGRKRRLRLPSGTAIVRRAPTPAEGLITVTDLHSAGSQAYRKLRTHLIFSTGGDPLRALLVTSPTASEGKSSVSSNLAVTFAQQKLRVLLIDADMRRARLHTLFGLDRLPGLTEVLARQATLEEVVRPTQVDGLSLLPAGTLVPNVSELLGSERMTALLGELQQRYDLLVVDTPPVLAAADAEILAVQTDATLVVVRAGQTERQSAQYAVQQLRAVGARVVGAVLNDPEEKVASYGRYTYYYDYYSKDAVDA
ncbi:MAG TPA: polysaccharide biosynthesis tyrosine autokinase [Longimicrobiaceae bacterium]|nr:polysaccharide biosynthesis tyrosine autokinase [Longimicrobiaceae bacterium]